MLDYTHTHIMAHNVIEHITHTYVVNYIRIYTCDIV